MKTLIRTGAVLSFGCIFAAGVMFLVMARPFPVHDGLVLSSIGLFLVGTAFFAGSMLWLAAEKCPAARDEPRLPSPGMLLKIVLALVAGVVALMACRFLFHGPPLPVS